MTSEPTSRSLGRTSGGSSPLRVDLFFLRARFKTRRAPSQALPSPITGYAELARDRHFDARCLV
jgi:hypothetical protein